jgi:hypothetical protein
MLLREAIDLVLFRGRAHEASRFYRDGQSFLRDLFFTSRAVPSPFREGISVSVARRPLPLPRSIDVHRRGRRRSQ